MTYVLLLLVGALAASTVLLALRVRAERTAGRVERKAHEEVETRLLALAQGINDRSTRPQHKPRQERVTEGPVQIPSDL